MIVPSLPFLFIFLSILVKTISKGKLAIIILLIFLFINNIFVTYKNYKHRFLGKKIETFFPNAYLVETIPSLKHHLHDYGENWIGMGKTIGKLFQYRKDIILSTKPAGAIPFYSKLYVIDILGLNDKWIAHNGFIRHL